MKSTALLRACAILSLVSALNVSAEVKVGDKPKLQGKTVDGQSLNLTQYSGKLVLVDFWATWCGPCMREAPHMVEINKKYGDQGLALIGISLDQAATDVKPVAKEKGLVWPHIWASGVWDSPYPKEWGVHGIPCTFLISPEGAVLWTGHPAELDPVLEKAFKEHPPQLVDAKTLAEATSTLDQVSAAVTSKDYPAAMKLLGKVPAAASKDAKTAEKIAGVQKDLGAFADSMLAEVDPLIQSKEYPQAIAKLRALSNQLSATPAGIKAKQKLNELAVNPEARKQIEAADKAEKADAALAAAEKLKDAKQDAAAYQRFKEITAMFAGTSAAEKATVAVKAYEADPVFVKKVVNVQAAQKAKAALSMADSYKGAGKIEQAKKKYQEVIDQYPGTAQAASAKQSVDQLKD